MTAQRPALADVLAVLTTYDNAAVWRLLLDDRERVIDRRGVRLGTWPSSIVPWAHATPADAIGALVEAALLPEHWARELTAPRWWCLPTPPGAGCAWCRSPPPHEARKPAAAPASDAAASTAREFIAMCRPGTAIL